MQRISLPIHGGGHLEVEGPLDHPRWALLLCRDNFRRDDPIMTRMSAFFTGHGFTVARYESRTAETIRRIDPPAIHRLPGPLRLALKGLRLLALPPRRWAHFSCGHRARVEGMPERVRALRELLAWIGRDRQVHVIARSASARAASLLEPADGIASLTAMGYPFEHPEHGPEPERVAHLANLRVPMLILQGTRDPYRGKTPDAAWTLSPSVRLEWLDTDHDFDLPAPRWDAILARIHEFILQAPR